MSEKIRKSEVEWRKILTPRHIFVTRQGAHRAAWHWRSTKTPKSNT